jgi:hypothetical protein
MTAELPASKGSPMAASETVPAEIRPASRAARSRIPITMWELLVWTYQRQKVHKSGGRDWSLGYGGGTGAALARLARGLPRAPIAMAAPLPHEDALTVHDYVMRLTAIERQLIIVSAELGTPPEWSPKIPPVKVVPVLRGNGKPKMLYPPRRNEPIACLIGYEGVMPRQAEALRERSRAAYRAWHSALLILAEALTSLDELTRWRVAEAGAAHGSLGESRCRAESRPFWPGQRLAQRNAEAAITGGRKRLKAAGCFTSLRESLLRGVIIGR